MKKKKNGCSSHESTGMRKQQAAQAPVAQRRCPRRITHRRISAPEGGGLEQRLGQTSVAGRRGRIWRTPRWSEVPAAGVEPAPHLEGPGSILGLLHPPGIQSFLLLCLSLPCPPPRRLGPACEVWESRGRAFVLTKTLIGTGGPSRSADFILLLAAAGDGCINAMAGIFEVVTL